MNRINDRAKPKAYKKHAQKTLNTGHLHERNIPM